MGLTGRTRQALLSAFLVVEGTGPAALAILRAYEMRSSVQQ